MSDATVPRQAATSEESPSARELLGLVYEELRQLAAHRMALESAGQTLQATALVHEAWLRLGGESQPKWVNRAQFFAAAAEAMRRILVDRARRRNARRHGGGLERVPFEGLELPTEVDDGTMLRLHEALNLLSEHDAEKARVVELRFFAGLTHEETAEILGVSEPTVKRHWNYARAWLYRQMQSSFE